MGGGGGGGDGGAGQREAERQARIKAATDTINGIFNNQEKKTRTETYWEDVPVDNGDGTYRNERVAKTREVEYWVDGDPANNRQQLYDQQRDAVYEINANEVNRQAGKAQRQTKFNLARAGQVGGSLDIDQNAELNRRTNEGLLQAGGLADASSAELKQSDERTRANLISMAQSGIDTGTAATMALQGLDANAKTSSAQRAGSTIGGLFDDIGQAYLQNQVNQGYRYGGGNYGVSSTAKSYSGS